MYRNEGVAVEEVVGAVIVMATVFVYIFGGLFVDSSVAVKALKNQGFTNVQVLDRDWLLVGFRGCDGLDAAKFTVRAVNPVGDTVETCVCSGWPFKNATIRTAK